MAAFLLVHLRADNIGFYQYPIISFVKENYPEVTVLDIDNASDDLIVNYAGQLVLEEAKVIVYFKPETPEVPFGSALKLVEIVIATTKQNIQVLAESNHNRLAAILAARPHISFLSSANTTDLQKAISDFYK